MTSSIAKKLGNIESFDMEEGHPFQSVDVAVYRTEKVIPYFSWNWLPSTSNFRTSILSHVDETATDFAAKEKYARRFMMLFLPFRTHEDLLVEGSYQKRFQLAIVNNEFDPEMLEIAENIQSIHNSLGSAMLENALTSETDLVEIDEVEEESETDRAQTLEDLLLSIGNLMAPTSGVEQLESETTEVRPTFGLVTLPDDCEEIVFSELEDVFRDSEVENAASVEVSFADVPKTQFQASTSQLNSLVLQRFLTRSELGQDGESTADSSTKEKWSVEATGTWQSIIAWARVADLDEEQQTAFEILVAIFVLSFHENKMDDDAASEDLEEQWKALCKLARRNPEEMEPLRMFITGPAGAGKCK